MLLSSGAIALSACASNSIFPLQPTQDDLIIQEFITREIGLIDIYFAGINQERSYRTQLAQLREHHLTHLTLWTKEVSATPNPSPTGLQVASIKQLILAEEDHLNFCLTKITITDNKEILQNIGQIASSVTQHIYWLNKMITPIAPAVNPNFSSSDVGEL